MQRYFSLALEFGSTISKGYTLHFKFTFMLKAIEHSGFVKYENL